MQRKVRWPRAYTVVDTATVMTTHLSEAIRRHAHELLGRQEAQQMLDHLKQSHPKVVEELVPNLLPLGAVVKVLHNLLREQVPIRDLLAILEALGDWASLTKDTDALTEHVRQALARTLTKMHAAPDGTLSVITLSHGVESALADALQKGDHGRILALDPAAAHRMMTSLGRQIERCAALNLQPVVLCSSPVRVSFKRLVDRFIPNLCVLSYDEVLNTVDIRSSEPWSYPMQIKRFEAKTMTAALKMVKDEFGPEAVILSARTLRQNRGFFGAARSSGVEVTAAMDTGWPAYTAAGRMAAQRVLTPAPSEAAGPAVRRGLFHSLNESLRSFAGRRAAPTPASSGAAPAAELAELYHHFLSQAVQRDLAADLIEHINRLPGYDPLLGLDRLRALAAPALQDMGLRGSVETGEPGSARAMALVGPNGAGKTSLVMKLAVVEAVRKGRRVALMTLDDQRIGAVEQLQIFAGILGVPLAVVTSAADARQVLDDWSSMDRILIDTPGVSPGESERPIRGAPDPDRAEVPGGSPGVERRQPRGRPDGGHRGLEEGPGQLPGLHPAR